MNKNLSQFVLKDYILLGYEGEPKLIIPKDFKTGNEIKDTQGLNTGYPEYLIQHIGYSVPYFNKDYCIGKIKTYFCNETLKEHIGKYNE